MSAKEIRDTVGLLLVVASLVFVGLELRQNNALARAQSRQWMTENYREWNMALASNKELHTLYRRVWFEEDSTLVDPEERGRANRAMFTNLRLLENTFLQVQAGVVDEQALQGYGWLDRVDMQTATFREFWQPYRNRFHPDFVAALEAAYNLSPR